MRVQLLAGQHSAAAEPPGQQPDGVQTAAGPPQQRQTPLGVQQQPAELWSARIATGTPSIDDCCSLHTEPGCFMTAVHSAAGGTLLV